MEEIDFAFNGVNCSILATNSGEPCIPNYLPRDLTEISEYSLYCVYAYCLVFGVAAGGNVLALKTLWTQHKIKQSRTSLLFLNLSLADLIVTCVIIPTEVFWRLTIQWMGGNLLCKLSEFMRAFGLYLSSMIIICVSVDRFLAIMFPLNMIGVRPYNKIKMMIVIAWIVSALFSIPQAVYFGLETHPEFPTFKQCVTSSFLNNSYHMKIYSVFAVVVMYFIPLLVIVFSYTAIFIKIARKCNQPLTGFKVRFRRCPQQNSVCEMDIQESETSNDNGSNDVRLRRSGNAEMTLARAKNRTLLLTIIFILAFIICWTPYAVMTLWYMIDWEGAKNVDPWIQDILFLMVVANSCINPLIYGSFHYGRVGPKRRAFCYPFC